MAADFWKSSHCGRWLFIDVNSALRGHHRDEVLLQLSASDIQCLRVYFMELIQKLGKKLKLRQRVIATAQVFFKRFYVENAFIEYDPRLVAPTVLFVAAKVEECALNAKFFLTAIQRLMNEPTQAPFWLTSTAKQKLPPIANAAANNTSHANAATTTNAPTNPSHSQNAANTAATSAFPSGSPASHSLAATNTAAAAASMSMSMAMSLSGNINTNNNMNLSMNVPNGDSELKNAAGPGGGVGMQMAMAALSGGSSSSTGTLSNSSATGSLSSSSSSSGHQLHHIHVHDNEVSEQHIIELVNQSNHQNSSAHGHILPSAPSLVGVAAQFQSSVQLPSHPTATSNIGVVPMAISSAGSVPLANLSVQLHANANANANSNLNANSGVTANSNANAMQIVHTAENIVHSVSANGNAVKAALLAGNAVSAALASSSSTSSAIGASGSASASGSGSAPASASTSGSGVGHQWLYSVDELLEMEFHVLYHLTYDLVVFHPYRPLTAFLADCQSLVDLMQPAWEIVNDSYKTELCLIYPPHLIAVAAIYLAAFIHQRDYKPWIARVNVNIEDLMNVTHSLLTHYLNYDQQYAHKDAQTKLYQSLTKIHRHFNKLNEQETHTAKT